ncbi:MAG: pectin esterase [Prevotellaceae bacterium]|jgi:pectinesterase|nr:pectin esterase [Prevotellaceae bacterium]
MKKLALLLVAACLCLLAQAYDIVVAQDGSGSFTTIQEAISSVRDYRPEGEVRIFIKKGVYREKVVVASQKTHITLIGEDVDSTILTHNDHAKVNNMGTFKTYTLLVQASDFRAENLTVENNAEQLGQAVAVHVEGDRAVFVNCKFLGSQDTLFTGNSDSRQLYKSCYIEGTTDFIFGPATAWFESCTLHSKKNSYITAASTPEQHKFGYVFHRCTLTAAAGVDNVYLGRPWRAFAAVAFISCRLGAHIRPGGWDNWRSAENEKTARYFEYKNTGAGAAAAQRVPWSHQLTDQQAEAYTVENALQGCDGWHPASK